MHTFTGDGFFRRRPCERQCRSFTARLQHPFIVSYLVAKGHLRLLLQCSYSSSILATTTFRMNLLQGCIGFVETFASYRRVSMERLCAGSYLIEHISGGCMRMNAEKATAGQMLLI